ncbi:MAG: Na(+)/H(+) antiporter subunit D [Syntrophobacteraceae bacterium]|jgi:multicomponent Na+:H+ antiporter subunit D|nr:Na(+)/H(+) antiporter subunit D [Syntrophobacteraceae bacterium]
MIDWFHPSLLFILGAFGVPFLRGKVQQTLLMAIPLLAVTCVYAMSPGTYWTYTFLGAPLTFGAVDKLSLVFGWVFSIMSFIGIVYALHVKDSSQHSAAFLYVGGSLGVTFAGDFFTLFIFWELMAFSSAYLVFASREKAAIAAGYRYILVHIFGGVCLLGGIILHYMSADSLAVGPLDKDGSLGFYLILIGVIFNAAVPPLHAWLTDAYPEGTVTGSVFMSAFTTKTAVYVLVRVFPGTELLVWMGTIMALYGVVYAVLENDARRLLAYHIISQVGYMVAGVGVGTDLSLNGSVSHAFAHILYKGLLFMGAGAVIMMTGRRKLTELGGLYKTMPITLVLYMIGGFAISAFPLFSGFVTKSMVVSGAAYDHRPVVALLLTMASAGTFLHTGLKLPYYMFFGQDSGIQAKEPPINMLIAMGMAAFLCIGIGVLPGPLYALLPYPVDYHPYTGDHVTSALGILLFTGLGFFMLLKKLDPEPTISVDTDWVYRKGSKVFMWFARKPMAETDQYVGNIYDTWITRFTLFSSGFLARVIDVRGIDGMVNGVAAFFMELAGTLRVTASGLVRNYAVTMLIGGILILGYYLFASLMSL